MSLKTTFLKDYQAPSFSIQTTHLFFNIHESPTADPLQSYVIVESKLLLQKNNPLAHELVLMGENLELLELKLNGVKLLPSQYYLTPETLTLSNHPDILAQTSFTLEVVTKIYPDQNTELMGLYRSGEMLCTQNEPEGFRKITYFLDRPDNMSIYTTTIEANKKRYPTLLSNGNLIEKTDLGERHRVKWHDPFKKPSYLFALVAGKFDLLKDEYTTCSGKKVSLQIFVDPGNLDKTAHAMESLKKSMQWDEKRFGLEYDLDTYMIVAASSFNMGAMENKGLNIFNSAYVLAKPETATDSDYAGIEGVIGHEYFHNWTGNRVTCRDWFQLTLKEGLTVFRDQEFSSDLNERSVNRISEIDYIRTVQFLEDASPMAHPIKPASYVEINNFYTATVYRKGAEVIRMIHTLIGEKNFQKGMSIYFKRHDGQAVTTEDFIAAMEEASGKDFTQFKNWYSQEGTPEIEVNTQYHFETKTFDLSIQQKIKENQKPFHFPFSIALYSKSGKEFLNKTLEVTELSQKFSLGSVPEEPILSLNRGFSAPILLKHNQSIENLLILFRHEKDAFSRYEAGQSIFQHLIISHIKNENANLQETVQSVSNIFTEVLKDSELSPAYKALLIQMPYLSKLSQAFHPIQFAKLFESTQWFNSQIAHSLHSGMKKLYLELEALELSKEYVWTPHSQGMRSLKNTLLGYLIYIPTEDQTAWKQFKNARNMTDQLASLKALSHLESAYTEDAMNLFYNKWKHEDLVIDKWFSTQATSTLPGVLERVKKLTLHPDFHWNNPNRVKSLLITFAGGNLPQFHHSSGEAYHFITNCIIKLDPLNPQVAARLLNVSFRLVKNLDTQQQNLIRLQLERIKAEKTLSKDVGEIVEKSLQSILSR